VQINKIVNPELTAAYTNSEMTLDGMLNEEIWKISEMVVLKVNRTGDPVNDFSQQTRVRSCYDSSTLYISFECNDVDIWSRYDSHDQHLWQEEAVEVFIDTDLEPDTYVEIEVSPRNVVFDSYIVDPINIDIAATKKFDLPGMRTAVFVDGTLDNRNDEDKQWIVEIAIPFDEIYRHKIQNFTDIRWRINFYRIDRDKNLESTGYAWSPTRDRFHKPSSFGFLTFSNSKL
jgi:hypothetical protein